MGTMVARRDLIDPQAGEEPEPFSKIALQRLNPR